MDLSTAITLIRKGIPYNGRPQRWADLGAGSGLFTEALANCLEPHSSIIAIDRDERSKALPGINNVLIERQTLDFVRDDLADNLDGVLMANALHFVKDKEAFFVKLRKNLKGSGMVIVVEYDLDRATPWVPFPVSYEKLSSDFNEMLQAVEEIGHADSIYQRSGMYSARLTFRKAE